MKESLAQRTVWKTKLPNLEHGIFPSTVPRPNPLVVDSAVFVSVAAPGAIVRLSRKSGKVEWRRELPPYGADSAYFAEGRLFAKSSNTLYALAPHSGNELWRFCPYGTSHEWIYSHPVVFQHRLFIGDRKGVLHCLDVGSGKSIWSVQTNRRQVDVNSTPIVAGGVVIVATNARTAIAFDALRGREVWRRRLDGPSVFGPLLHRGMVVVVTDSVYLLSAKTGKVEHHLRWPGKSASYVENFGSKLAVIVRDPTCESTRQMFICDFRKRAVEKVPMDVWCPELRYDPKTGMGYLSHLNGLQVLDRKAATVASFLIRDDGVGVVDVKDGVIYLATNRGRICAVRHPVRQ